MSEINKGFYAIIPANIRYDSEIPPNAKLLYSEITALCNVKGYCWPTNEYFAELYNVSERTISRWISKLIQKAYIVVEYQYKVGTKEILKRYIKLAGHTESVCEENACLGSDKNVNTYRQKCHLGGDKNVRENNINNNNIINNYILSSSEDEPVDNSVDNLELISKIIEYLNQKCSTDYKSTNKKTKTCITARLNEGYRLEDFIKVIDIKSAEWLNNPDMCKYLRPETLFGNKFEGYLNQKQVKAQAAKQQKPANKFHNHIQGDRLSESEMEALAEKRKEKLLNNIARRSGQKEDE